MLIGPGSFFPLCQLTKKMKAHDDKERGAFQGMFDKIRLRDATIAATNASTSAEVQSKILQQGYSVVVILWV